MNKKQKITAAFSLVAVIILYSPLTGAMNIALASLLTGVAGTGLSGIIGYLALAKLHAFSSPTTAKGYAKVWFGYVFALLCLIRLNSFLIHLDMEYLAQFILLVIVYGALAGIFGYLFGKFKLRKNK